MLKIHRHLFIGIVALSLLLSSQALSQSDISLESRRQMADSGNIEAMIEMGQAYETGQSLAQDYSIAVEWYEKATLSGLSLIHI